MTITTSITSNPVLSSMRGAPIGVPLVPPGRCQFGDELHEVSLIERMAVSPTSYVLRFACPDTNRPLNLSTCACLVAMARIRDEDIYRAYTPISTNADVGFFDLLIKDYPDHEALSKHLTETIQPGDKIAFKHTAHNVKIQYTEEIANKLDRIGMLVGGTGVTPMIQVLHAILGNRERNGTKPIVTMLYGSRTSDDILGHEILHQWAVDYPDQFELVDILSHEPEESDWKGERGFIDRAMLEKYFPKPTDENFMIFICGPPPMYAALTGPKKERDRVSGLCGEMGYKPEQIVKF